MMIEGEIAIHDLRGLMAAIDRKYPFDAPHYPVLAGANPQEVVAFGVSHEMKHVDKSKGRIANETEKVDHGGQMDLVKSRKAAVKLLVSALRTTSVLGMDTDEVAAFIRRELAE